MHDTLPTANTGDLIKTYRVGRGPMIVSSICASIPVLVALFLVYFVNTVRFPDDPPAADRTTSTFNGPPAFLYGIIVFLLILAALMFAVAFWQKRLNAARFELYELGICHVAPGVSDFVPFVEIDDLYLLAVGQTGIADLINGVAYRRNSAEKFRVVTPLVDESDEFIERVRELHVQQRLPQMLDTLGRGGVVQFNYADSKQIWSKRIAGNFLKIKTRPLMVSAQYLEVDGRRTPIGLLRDADTSTWTGKVTLKDNDGQVVLSTIATGIMGMDLFLNVLAYLQEHQLSPIAEKFAADL